MSMSNRGGVVPLSELATEVIPSELLQKLKSECGGLQVGFTDYLVIEELLNPMVTLNLQTLLRNHNYIFVVISGSVRYGRLL